MRKSAWELLIEGDREAFISIYETNYQHLFTYGFSLCGDKELTKDCIQDLFLEIWNTRSHLTTEVSNVRSYLFTWLRRKITKELSRSAHNQTAEQEKGISQLLNGFVNMVINRTGCKGSPF